MARDDVSVSVIDVSPGDVIAYARGVAEREGLTLQEFVARGHTDELEGELRDLWLMVGPVVEGR